MERRRLLAVVAVIVAVVLVVIAVLLLRSPEEIPIAGPEPTPTPTSAPAPTPIVHDPVQGEVEVETVVTYHGPILFRSGDGRHAAPGTDGEAVDAFVGDITDWLDRHLTDLQGGLGGHLHEVAAGGLLDDADPATVAGLTTDLTSFLAPITAARYRIVVAAEGGPQWAQVRVDVTVHRIDPEGGQQEEDGDDAEETTRSAEFTFVAEDDGATLIAAAPVDPEASTMRIPPPPEDGRHRW